MVGLQQGQASQTPPRLHPPWPDQPVYQAASRTRSTSHSVRNFGHVFLARTQDSITLMELGEECVPGPGHDGLGRSASGCQCWVSA